MAISFHLGKLKIFHFESKSLIAEFKSSFGNFITINYSNDGKLLGIGSESDEAFIIDSETYTFLHCLEGHKNYVSSIIFDERPTNDYDQNDEIEDVRNMLNSSNLDIHPTEFNSNQENMHLNGLGGMKSSTTTNNYLRQSTVSNINGFGMNQINYYKQPTRQINPIELFQNLNEEIENYNSNTTVNKVFDPRSLRRTRTSVGNQAKANNISYDANNLNNNNINNNDNKECKIYDIYTAGYDGFLGVFRIEFYFDLEENNQLPKGVLDLSIKDKDSSLRKLTLPKPILLENLSEKNVLYTDFVKIQNVPIYKLIMVDNMLVMISKRNNQGSSVFVKFYHGILLTDEPEIKNVNNDKKISEEAYNNTVHSQNNSTTFKRKNNINLDTKYPDPKLPPVNAKNYGNNNSSTNASMNHSTYSNNETKERESKERGREVGERDVKEARRSRDNSHLKNNTGNTTNKYNKSPYKEGK